MTAAIFHVEIHKGFGTEDIQYPNCTLCLVSWFIKDGAKAIKICLSRQFSVLTAFYLHSNYFVMLLANSKHFFQHITLAEDYVSVYCNLFTGLLVSTWYLQFK